jgi:hypothetical protein
LSKNNVGLKFLEDPKEIARLHRENPGENFGDL